MFKKCLLTAATLIIHLSTQAQDVSWQKVQLDDSTTIEFPGLATKKEVGGQQAFVFQNEQVIYSVVIQKNSFEGSPSDSVLTKFYRGALSGTIDAAGGGDILVAKAFVADGFTGLEAQYTTPNKPALPRVKTLRFLLANEVLYTANFWTDADRIPEVDSARIRFFSSLHTTRVKAPVTTDETQGSGYASGYLMGKLFFYGALLLGIVVVIKRFSKRKAA